MSINRVQRVAVIGAGPIGLEAALEARLAGLDVVVMDTKAVGANVSAWGFVEMFTPWVLNTTPLGRAAAGDSPILSSPDLTPTGNEFVDRYLWPLSQCDALQGCIDTGVRVFAVGADVASNGGDSSPESGCGSGRPRFNLLVSDRFGVDQKDHADVVLDCSGTYGHSRWTGRGGIPAMGELGVKESIWYAVPDVLGNDRARFADRHTLLIGTGTSAATILMNLARLVDIAPQTRVTWVFHRWGKLLKQLDEDPLRPPPAWREDIASDGLAAGMADIDRGRRSGKNLRRTGNGRGASAGKSAAALPGR